MSLVNLLGLPGAAASTWQGILSCGIIRPSASIAGSSEAGCDPDQMERDFDMKTAGIFASLLLLTGLYSAPGYAQTIHATIRGQVTGIAGSPFPNVQVSAVNLETGDIRRAVSGSDGEFTFSVLSPGSYRLEAEMAGFRKYVETGIILQVGQNQRVTPRL